MTRALLILAIAASIGACGVATSRTVSTADRGDVPYGLLEPGIEETTTTLPELARRPVDVWFVIADRIVSVPREVATPLTAARAVKALVEGPTDDEAALGVRSALPADAVVDVEVVDGTASVDLTTSFSAASSRAQILGLGQLVYSVTEVPGVDAVRFRLEGQPVDVPRSDGSISDGPVSRFDYAALRSA